MKDHDILKWFCQKMFWLGLGDVWLVGGVVGNARTRLYRLYSLLILITSLTLVGLETLAALIGDFPEDQKNEAITLSVSHSLDLIKIFTVLYNRQSMIKLIQDLVKVCAPHEKDDEMAEKYKTIKYNTFAYVMFISISAVFYYFEGLRKVLNGEHYVVIVTYWPKYEDQSRQAIMLRVIISIITTLFLIWLVLIDCFAMTFLIIVKYKFRTLGNYFESLTEILGEKKEGKEFILLFTEGIIMHQEILRVTRVLDGVFGFMMSMHVVKSYTSVVLLLLSVVLAEQWSTASALKSLFFIIALIFLLALFLCNAGEITLQSAQLSQSIFISGWHLCPREEHARLGWLVMTSCKMAQRPLVIKAFNMFDLTYSTFISVMKGIYSLFTLFYKQNQKAIQ